MNPYREQAPPPALARWIESAWSVVTTRPLTAYPVRPDGCLDIVFDRAGGLRVVGAMTTEKRYDFPAGTEMCGIRFHPGRAAPFLRTTPALVTDAIIPVEDLWGRGARELADRVLETGSPGECLGVLMAAMPPPEQPLTPIQRAIEAMSRARGMVDLDEIARQANLSPRQFRRRCLEESGLTPKHLCRILRFRHACELASSSRRPVWPGIAVEAGYFDQAHLIHDFREFTGATPVSVFSNTAEPEPGRIGA